MNTKFNVRKKVLGNLNTNRFASRNGHAKSSNRSARISPPKTNEPVVIDSMMFGETEMMAAHLLPGPRPAIVDPGPANTADGVIESIESLGVDSIDAILLTHIHFDHAGGTGHLARRFPEATVYVHPRVAKHLSDPTALVQGVKSVWGPPTEELFGLPVPIDASRIQRLEDGQSVDLGDRRIEAISSPPSRSSASAKRAAGPRPEEVTITAPASRSG